MPATRCDPRLMRRRPDGDVFHDRDAPGRVGTRHSSPRPATGAAFVRYLFGIAGWVAVRVKYRFGEVWGARGTGRLGGWAGRPGTCCGCVGVTRAVEQGEVGRGVTGPPDQRSRADVTRAPDDQFFLLIVYSRLIESDIRSVTL